MSATPDSAAEQLGALRLGGGTTVPFTDTHPDLDAAWGYAVQDVDRGHRVRDGERVVGAKLGLTSEAKQRRMEVDRPIVGFLTAPMLLAPDAVSDRLPSWQQPRIEPEIAFITSHTIDGPLTVAEASRRVGHVLLAAEILDSRFTGYRFGLADVIADNTSAAGVVLGAERHDLASVGDLSALHCRVTVDGEIRHEATGSAILGDPLQSLVLLAQHVGERGQTLPAGSLVLAGALTDAEPLVAGHDYRIEIEGLGVVDVAL